MSVSRLVAVGRLADQRNGAGVGLSFRPGAEDVHDRQSAQGTDHGFHGASWSRESASTGWASCVMSRASGVMNNNAIE